jgi:hypothetical protein
MPHLAVKHEWASSRYLRCGGEPDIRLDSRHRRSPAPRWPAPRPILRLGGLTNGMRS